MPKVLIFAAALVLCAGQARAQQGDAVSPGEATAASAAAQVRAPVERAPSLFVSTEVIRSRVQRAEAARKAEEPTDEERDAWAVAATAAISLLMVLVFTS
jgi:hypothetical protein